jgi:DNA-binding NarL/FixJ family response regulator
MGCGGVELVVVDDSELLRRKLKEVVKAIPGLVLAGEARTAAEGLALIRRCRPDVVLLDIGLPDRSGVEVLEELMTEARPPRVIVLAGNPTPALNRRCLDLGAEHFLEKGTETCRLREVLTSLEGVGVNSRASRQGG